MLVEILLNIVWKKVMGYIKGKSSLMIFNRYTNLKHKYVDRNF